MSVTFGPRFTRWRALLLAERRNILLQATLISGLTTQYIQPSAPSLSRSEELSKVLVPASGNLTGLTPADGFSETMTELDRSGMGLVPAGGSGVSLKP